MTWRTAPLVELTENFDAQRIPVKEADRRPGPYPYYGASGIVDFVDEYIFDGEYLLVAEDGENLRTRKTPVAFMAKGRFWVNNHAHILRGNEAANTRFLSYALSKADIGSYLTGSTMPKLTQGNLNRILVPAPPRTTQDAIASILGALDDKIELNRRTNQTLEAIARAIFKSWFVDFDPVRAKMDSRQPFGMDADTAALFPSSFSTSGDGPLPVGWTLGNIGDIAEVIDCLHSRKPQKQEAGWPMIQLNNIRDDGLLEMTETYWITRQDYQLWTSRIEVHEGDCVVTNVGRVGASAQVPPGLRAAIGRNMTAVRPRMHFPYPTFLIEALLSNWMRDEIGRKTDTGTILDALNVRNIPMLRLAIAGHDVLTAFESLARPLRALMEQCLSESRKLGVTRDALLPKLLSGELRVKDAEKLAGEVV